MGFQGEVWTVRGRGARGTPTGEPSGDGGGAAEPAGAGDGGGGAEVGRDGGAAVAAGGAGDEIGEILIDDADFPWLSGRFTPGPGFGAVRDLFARELALAQGEKERWAEWETVCGEVGRRVALSSPDGPVPEFLLHIDGDRAWFRWSDEPFADEEADGDADGENGRRDGQGEAGAGSENPPVR